MISMPNRKTLAAMAALLLGAAAAAPAFAQQHKARYAYGSVSLSYLPIYLAEDLGYMKEFGVAIDTSVIKGGSGPAAAATLSGSIDFYVGLLFSAAPAVEKGQPLIGFATTLNQYGSTIVVSKEVADKHRLTKATPVEERLNALRGLRVASFGPNSSSDLLVRFIAKRKGWNADTDMQLVPIGGAPALAAFEQKRIDAIVHSSPIADVAVNKFGGNMIVNLAAGEYTPLADMPYITLVANANWLAKNKETAARVTAAIWKAMDYAHSKPEETRAILRKRFPSIDQE
ncbi:MAG: ABC transporter substrate-binding protein, partial [Alphaproteobacteria bacterium]|nr:ABC transporter substrate-binding protein [Alphaproteobacteria bacterium]